MKRLRFLLGILFPFIVLGQESSDNGINWISSQSWQLVKQKAKKENKFIFVDCFTTWCKPCREMDKEVYVQRIVGNRFNDNFLSIKVQIDSTKNDNDEIKRWYHDAARIKETYRVASYPCLLFFDPKGRLVYKHVGKIKADRLIAMASEIADPNKQYYTLLERFRKGERDPEATRFLIKISKNLGDEALTKQISSEYIKGLSESQMLTSENLDVIYEFTNSTKDKGFLLFYKNVHRINEIKKSKDYAQRKLNDIIFNERIYKPIIEPNYKINKSEPEWEKITSELLTQFDSSLVVQILHRSKKTWYGLTSNWAPYCSLVIDEIADLDSTDRLWAFTVNNTCWDLFRLDTNRKELQIAASWMERVFKHDLKYALWPTAMDTYANLLYKLGNVEDAIFWQELAAKIDPTNPEFGEHLDKMRKREPTWKVFE